jgi:hypothetical protein
MSNTENTFFTAQSNSPSNSESATNNVEPTITEVTATSDSNLTAEVINAEPALAFEPAAVVSSSGVASAAALYPQPPNADIDPPNGDSLAAPTLMDSTPTSTTGLASIDSTVVGQPDQTDPLMGEQVVGGEVIENQVAEQIIEAQDFATTDDILAINDVLATRDDILDPNVDVLDERSPVVAATDDFAGLDNHPLANLPIDLPAATVADTLTAAVVGESYPMVETETAPTAVAESAATVAVVEDVASEELAAESPEAPPVQAQAVQIVIADYEEEYLCLLTASQFLATIQNVALFKEQIGEYDTTDIFELIHYRKQNTSFSSTQEQQLRQQLSKFRQHIEQTDAQVYTSSVRRLFDVVGTPDGSSLERVISYYLAKINKTATDRDKVDLLVTRWGSFRIPGSGQVALLRSETKLRAKLESMFSQINLPLSDEYDEEEVLDWLKKYQESLLSVQDMGDIIAKNYKARLREFKLAMGDFFYRPAVLAGVVEANTTLHNVLQEFYASERARLETYVDKVKQKGVTDPQAHLFTLMNRAEEMRRLLDETQAAINAQQVVDQTVGLTAEGTAEGNVAVSDSAVAPVAAANNSEPLVAAADEPPRSANVDKLVAMLEETLQRTNELSRQLQQELQRRQ